MFFILLLPRSITRPIHHNALRPHTDTHPQLAAAPLYTFLVAPHRSQTPDCLADVHVPMLPEPRLLFPTLVVQQVAVEVVGTVVVGEAGWLAEEQLFSEGFQVGNLFQELVFGGRGTHAGDFTMVVDDALHVIDRLLLLGPDVVALRIQALWGKVVIVISNFSLKQHNILSLKKTISDI